MKKPYLSTTNVHPFRFYKIQKFLNLEILGNGCWLAGGSLMSVIDPTMRVKDYDLFFKDRDSYLNVFHKLKDLGFEISFASDNSKLINVSHPNPGETYPTEPIQFILHKEFHSVEEILSGFDLVPCLITFDGETLTISKRAIESIKKKQLYIHNTGKRPVGTFRRLLKYKDEKGFEIPIETMTRFVVDVSDMFAPCLDPYLDTGDDYRAFESDILTI